MKKRGLICIVIATLLMSNAPLAYAVPKSKPCKVYQKDLCVNKNTIPKSFRSKLSGQKSNFLMPLQRYPLSSSFKVPPQDNPPGTARPQILIPAGTESITVCRIVAGKMDCTVLTAFKECPSRFSFQDESGAAWSCDLDCDNRRPNGDPDANGNCDCDIEYDTCTPGYN